jgi:hypothetical protein
VRAFTLLERINREPAPAWSLCLVATKPAALDFPDRSNQSREAPNVQFLNILSMFKN